MKYLLIIFLLVSVNMTAQIDSVRIPYTNHYIVTIDKETKKATQDFIYYMETRRVFYERPMLKLKGFSKRPDNRLFVSSYKDGIITLNTRLDEYPHCKIAAIMQEFYKICGGKVKKEPMTSVIGKFNVSERSEEIFRRQMNGEYMLRFLARKLED